VIVFIAVPVEGIPSKHAFLRVSQQAILATTLLLNFDLQTGIHHD
jgi:hypothetical protein